MTTRRRLRSLAHPVDFSGYVDIADVMLLTLDVHGRVSHINQRGCDILGIADPRDILERDWFGEFVPVSDRDAVRNVFARLMEGDAQTVERFENPVITSTGEERLLAWHNAPLVADGRVVGAISSGLDITGRRAIEQQEAQLLRELTDLKYALDHSAIVAVTDAQGRITYVNDTFCEIAKYSRGELLGRTHRIVNSGHHPKAFFQDLWSTISSGRIWRGDIRNQAKDGALYWVDTTIVPFLDTTGTPYQYMAIRYEISQRKAVEERLRQQETLARLGELAAIVAHEVKNPLAGISGALQVIGSRLPADGRDRAVIDDIQRRIHSLNDMVQDLLLFARPQRPVPSVIALTGLIREVAAALAHDPTLSATRVRVCGDHPTLRVDREQLRIVFQNLLINAAQAMNGAGRIVVVVRANTATCVVTIADRGPGLAPDVVRQMFEPFFTTKHRGSGLGLPIALQIVEAHGGSLSIENRISGGAVVTVSLPTPLP